MAYESSWPVGLRVWVACHGEWHSGLIESRTQGAAYVRLDSGELVYTGFNRGVCVSKNPGKTPVPKSRRRTTHTGVPNLFFRDENGRLLKRNPAIWSTRAERCLGGCGSDRPHFCKGYCANCYQRWKRSTDPKWRDRTNAKAKEGRMRRADVYEARDKARANNPKRREQRRVISARYANKNSAWPIGSVVETPLANFDLTGAAKLTRKSAPWKMPIRGEILQKTNAAALVKFGTFEAWVPFARLRMVGRRVA